MNYSGKYGFTETRMYWPLTHGVVPKEQALTCNECHGANSRLNWQALGYDGSDGKRRTAVIRKSQMVKYLIFTACFWAGTVTATGSLAAYALQAPALRVSGPAAGIPERPRAAQSHAPGF